MSKVLRHVSASVLALIAGLLPVSQSVAGESSTRLTLKTRYTKATCLFTRNGADATGVQVVTMPVIDSGMVNNMGSGEWTGEVVPLNLGMRCPQLPEESVGIALTVTPEISDTSAGNNVIASKKTTGNGPGPDLLLVDTGNHATRVTFSPGLALPGKSCSGDKAAGSADCLQLTGNQQDYRIPLGIRVFVPAEGQSDFHRVDMLTPGTWSSVVTLNISYQ
ncbi:hypothetical protein FPC62_19610 [Salmonella enterica]|uniref:Fimbrial protein n=1 Tax=Salmonella enterica TaxID=28901 RepID=A0A5T8BFX2_SALER|nr:hypothetical protein [Salmonella enterica]EDU4886662.1 hypothetical protein [Salmonella enterica subsp. enterica serovar Java]EBN4403376.1 hypothetical protein [Salmonella enterica]EBU0748170.1 hypothetical protein [Salmonella enterica]ECH3816247.1 hypothetical protein [Salmonella enterica]